MQTKSGAISVHVDPSKNMRVQPDYPDDAVHGIDTPTCLFGLLVRRTPEIGQPDGSTSYCSTSFVIKSNDSTSDPTGSLLNSSLQAEARTHCSLVLPSNPTTQPALEQPVLPSEHSSVFRIGTDPLGQTASPHRQKLLLRNSQAQGETLLFAETCRPT
jgi:hypothetical protein